MLSLLVAGPVVAGADFLDLVEQVTVDRLGMFAGVPDALVGNFAEVVAVGEDAADKGAGDRHRRLAAAGQAGEAAFHERHPKAVGSLTR